MKRILNTIMAAGLLLFAATACRESTVDDLDGIYPAPNELEFSEMSDLGVESEDAYNLFSVGLTGEGGMELVLELAAAVYYLPAGDYSPSSRENAVPGRYIAEESYLERDGVKTYISSGTVSVKKTGDNYVISGALWLDNEADEIIRFSQSGTLVYVRTPMTLSNVYEAIVTPLDGGVSQVILNMNTAGITPSFSTANNEWTFAGNGNVAQITLFVDGSTLLPGTYTAADTGANVVNFVNHPENYTAGTFAKGIMYHLVVIPGLLELDVPIYSNWFDVADSSAAQLNAHLTSGEITVSKTGNEYTVVIDSGGVYAQYVGAIDLQGGSTPDPDPDGIVLANVFSSTIYTHDGGLYEVELMMATEGLTPAKEGDNWTFTGSGSYVVASFITTSESLPAGTYTGKDVTVVDAGTRTLGGLEANMFINGQALLGFIPLFSQAVTVTDGVAGTPTYLTGGTVAVTQTGNVYKLTFDCGDIQAEYEGAIDIGDPEPVEEITLSSVYEAIVTPLEDGVSLVSLGLNTAGVAAAFVDNAWAFSGDGNVAQITFFVEGDTLLPDTYTAGDVGVLMEGSTPKPTGYTAGTFAKGVIYHLVIIPGLLEMDVPIYSNLLDVVDSAAATLNSHIDSGTITVGKTGDVYTIQIDCGSVQAEYEGAITFN